MMTVARRYTLSGYSSMPLEDEKANQAGLKSDPLLVYQPVSLRPIGTMHTSFPAASYGRLSTEENPVPSTLDRRNTTAILEDGL